MVCQPILQLITPNDPKSHCVSTHITADYPKPFHIPFCFILSYSWLLQTIPNTIVFQHIIQQITWNHPKSHCVSTHLKSITPNHHKPHCVSNHFTVDYSKPSQIPLSISQSYNWLFETILTLTRHIHKSLNGDCIMLSSVILQPLITGVKLSTTVDGFDTFQCRTINNTRNSNEQFIISAATNSEYRGLMRITHFHIYSLCSYTYTSTSLPTENSRI